MTSELPLSDAARVIVLDLAQTIAATGRAPELKRFRLKHEAHRPLITELTGQGVLETSFASIRPRLQGLRALGDDALPYLRPMVDLLPALKDLLRSRPQGPWSAGDLLSLGIDDGALRLALSLFRDIPNFFGVSATSLLDSEHRHDQFHLTEDLLDLQ